ncbi:MAG: hypothetical protein ACRERC_20860 [Candidatus Binatia bacterium]
MKRFLAVLMMAMTLTLAAGAPTVQADTSQNEDTYEDAFSNPLRLAYYVIYPVGFTVEWLVMRPFHYIISRPYLDRFFGYEPIGEEGSVTRMGEHM